MRVRKRQRRSTRTTRCSTYETPSSGTACPRKRWQSVLKGGAGKKSSHEASGRPKSQTEGNRGPTLRTLRKSSHEASDSKIDRRTRQFVASFRVGEFRMFAEV